MALPGPRPGILEITPYVGGKAESASGKPVAKLSSNESPLGPEPAGASPPTASWRASCTATPTAAARRLRAGDRPPLQPRPRR